MTSNNNYDVLIVGGGPAGIYAASVAKIKGLSPILIEVNDYLGGQPLVLYSQKNIEDYPGYTKIKAYQLIDSFITQLKSLHVPTYLKTTIVGYEQHAGYYEVQLSNNQQVQVKAIVLATGPGMFTPNYLTIKNNQDPRIQYSVSDIKDYQNKQVIILGGGDSAVDWANELSKVANSMTIIHRRNEFRANGQNVAQLKNNHVHVLLDYEILDIVDNQLICQTNQTHEISKLPFDTIIVQYGQVINGDGLKIFKGLAVNENKRVLVDAAQRTSLPNIYAIGNLCIYEGKPSSIICAHGEAAVAIRHILNDIKAYDRPKTH